LLTDSASYLRQP